jgi:transcriptional regulator with XRE-family HTH domain
MDKGITQVAFARDCGMEKSSMCKIEAGKINISYLTLNKISDCLGVELKELV